MGVSPTRLRPLLEKRSIVASLSMSIALLACSGDHALLAEKPSGPGEDAAPAMGDEPTPVDGVLEPVDASPGPPVDPEPPGRWALTWLNGVVDQELVRFCFVPITDAGESPLPTPPIPEAGLAFGESMVLPSLPSVDPALTSVHPYLVLGSPGAADTRNCSAIVGPGAADAGQHDAGPEVLSLPILPAGTLADARSYLAVAAGCASAVGDVDGSSARTAACGAFVGANNVSLVLVRLSRRLVAPNIGFQSVHASSATPTASVELDQSATQKSIASLGKISFSQIAPPAQPATSTPLDLGSNPGSAVVQTAPALANSFSPAVVLLKSALSESHLTLADVMSGSSVTFVLLGSPPGVSPVGPWHAFQVAVVKNSPLSDGD